MPKMVKIFTGESCKPNRRIPLSVKLLGSYEGHVWAISGPCFGYFYNILAKETSMLNIRILLNVDLFGPLSNYWDHIRAMFWPY